GGWEAQREVGEAVWGGGITRGGMGRGGARAREAGRARSHKSIKTLVFRRRPRRRLTSHKISASRNPTFPIHVRIMREQSIPPSGFLSPNASRFLQPGNGHAARDVVTRPSSPP